MNIQDLREEGDGDILGYFCRGHVDARDFCREINVGWGDPDAVPASVSHIHARFVPRPKWGYKAREFVVCKPGNGEIEEALEREVAACAEWLIQRGFITAGEKLRRCRPTPAYKRLVKHEEER
jgi:hypothetical protein